jgi:hypothetical protein
MIVAFRSRVIEAGTIKRSKSLVNVDLSFKFVARRGLYSISPSHKHEPSKGSAVDNAKSASNSTFGVFKESESDDVDVLINNFTAPALARALRERETTLHNAAHLVDTGNLLELAAILRPFLKSSIDKRRKESFEWDISSGLTRRELILVQRQLHRMPREVFQATSRRASVVIPLCNVSGEFIDYHNWSSIL